MRYLHERTYARARATIIDDGDPTLKPEQARSRWHPFGNHTMSVFWSWAVRSDRVIDRLNAVNPPSSAEHFIPDT